MATKQKELADAALGQGAIGKSRDDEPIFVIVARDRLSSESVRSWARRFLALRMGLGTFNETAQSKYNEALDCADRMDEWRETNVGGKGEIVDDPR